MFSDSSLKDIKRMSIVMFFMTVIMFIIFAFFGKCNLPTFFGAVLGYLFAVLNFVLLAIAVEKALKKDKKNAEMYMQSTQFLRLIILAIMIFVAIKVKAINQWSAIIPLFFQRFAVYILRFYDSRKEAK